MEDTMQAVKAFIAQLHAEPERVGLQRVFKKLYKDPGLWSTERKYSWSDMEDLAVAQDWLLGNCRPMQLLNHLHLSSLNAYLSGMVGYEVQRLLRVDATRIILETCWGTASAGTSVRGEVEVNHSFSCFDDFGWLACVTRTNGLC